MLAVAQEPPRRNVALAQVAPVGVLPQLPKVGFRANLLGRAFDDCSETQSTFKLLHVFGSLTERKLISAQLSDKMPLLVNNLITEMDEAKTIFLKQEARIRKVEHN